MLGPLCKCLGKQVNPKGRYSPLYPTPISPLQQDYIYFFQKSSSTPAHISTQQVWSAWQILAWVPSAWKVCRPGQHLSYSAINEGWRYPSTQESRQGQNLQLIDRILCYCTMGLWELVTESSEITLAVRRGRNVFEGVKGGERRMKNKLY